MVSAILLACLICGGDPEGDFYDMPRMGGYPFPGRAVVPASPDAARARPVAAPSNPGFVDLSWPGALERLARENPEHHRRAQELLALAGAHPCEVALDLLRKRPDVADTSCVARTLLPNDPPRRLLGFTLDQTRYMAFLAKGE